jgi:hypothetical protein
MGSNSTNKELRQYKSIHSKTQTLFFQFSPTQFHKKLKTSFFRTWLCLPPGLLLWFLTLAFVFVIHCHFHLSFTLNSITAFYFMDEVSTVLLNMQTFLCIAFCSTLNQRQSHLVLMSASFHFILLFFVSQYLLRKLLLSLTIEQSGGPCNASGPFRSIGDDSGASCSQFLSLSRVCGDG